MTNVKIKTVPCKSVLTKSHLPDADYVINPYVGCTHSCVYCYAQFMKRFTGHGGEKWGTFMDVKDGWTIPDIDYSGKTILIGSVTDPYNMCEEKYKGTREALEQLKALGVTGHVEILTKSNLILRDLDLLKEFPDLNVGVSLSSVEEGFAKLVEPYAPSPEVRINTMKTLHDNGIVTYNMMSPIFPIFSDWKSLINILKGHVNRFCFENLNLRANYKYDIFKLIEKNYPQFAEGFESLYNDPVQLRDFWENMAAEIESYVGNYDHKIYFFHAEIRK